jgi:hypothetical protein
VSETQAGSIVGLLRLDISSFEAGIAKAQSLADELERKNPNVKVTADTAGAETKLAAVAASEDKVAKSSKGSSTGLDSVVASARKLSDASAQANVAQLRLGEMQGSGTAKASSLASAQNTLARAQRDVSDAMKNASPEAQRLADSMGKADLSNVKVVESNKKVGSSSKDAGVGMGSLIAAVVALGPAIVPIAAGAAGLAVGFGGMGAAGILALVGIKQQMAAGTPIGGAYTSMVGTLKGDLTQLGATAAKGVLGPFQHEVATLQTQMPGLNGVIGQFSVITGKTAGMLVNGLVSAFIKLEPVARDVGVYVLNLSQKFAGLMSGGGVTTFGNYIRSVFPAVMQTVESVVTAVVHLVQAIAPMGMGSLGILRMLATVISAIPVDVLATLAQTAAAVYIGFKSYGLLSGGVTAVGTALQFLGVSAETAATGMVALNLAAGVIGVVIAAATLLYSANAQAVQADQAAVNTLTDALIANNGVIDASTIKEQANAIAKDGTLAAAKSLGYGLGDVTAASLGLADGTAKVTAHTDALNAAWYKAGGPGSPGVAMTSTFHDNALAMAKVTDATKNGVSQLGLAKQAYNLYVQSQKTGTTATHEATTADLLNMTAQQQATSATQAQKTAIQQLNTAMDEEISRQLQLAGATSGLDQAVLTMNTTLKTNNKTMDEHTQAGIDDRGAIERVVGSLQSQRDIQIKAGASTADATAKYQTSGAAQLDLMGKINGTTSAAYLYMKQLLAVPADVSTAIKADTKPAQTAVQQIQAKIDAIRQGKVPGLSANSHAAQVVILDYQARIDAIRQKALTKLGANPAPAVATIGSLTNQINAIRQGKVPGLTANSHAAQTVIQDLQLQILRLRGTTVPIVIQYTAGGVNLTTPSSVGRKAAGGPIDGVGTGTSDSNLILASKGEHMLTASDVTAAGGHGAITAWRKSLHKYAAGGPIIVTTPTGGMISSALNRGASNGATQFSAPSWISGVGGAAFTGGSGGSGGNAANKAIMQAMATRVFGWGSQLGPLNYLMMRESGYSNTAQNPTSTAYGMGQFLDSTWAGYGPKTSNPYLQSLYTLEYIKGRYTNPAGAAAHEQAFNWYGNGTSNAAPGWAVVGDKGPELMKMRGGEQVVPNHELGGNGATSADIATVTAAINHLLSAMQALPRAYQTMQRQYA